jgi:hypothetical protein
LKPNQNQRTIGSGYLKPNQNQRTIGSGYLKPNQNQRTASSVYFKNPSENPSLGFMKELAFFAILEADVKLKPQHKTI